MHLKESIDRYRSIHHRFSPDWNLCWAVSGIYPQCAVLAILATSASVIAKRVNKTWRIARTADQGRFQPVFHLSCSSSSSHEVQPQCDTTAFYVVLHCEVSSTCLSSLGMGRFRLPRIGNNDSRFLLPGNRLLPNLYLVQQHQFITAEWIAWGWRARSAPSAPANLTKISITGLNFWWWIE